jgi:opacity protein-like surface antigen
MKQAGATLAVVANLVLAGTAEAQTRRSQDTPQTYSYIFGEYDHYSAPGGSLDGGGIGAGYRLGRYFGMQAGGQYSRKSGVDLTSGYVEALGVFPLARRLSLYGSFGGAYATVSTSVGTATVSVSRSGYRAGAGLEYWMSPSWGLRASYHRQNTFGIVDDAGIGLAFRF